MSDNGSFRCPVCRAAQTLRDTCRRCQADLSLVRQAYRRLDFVKQQYAQALSRGDSVCAQSLERELRWFTSAR